VRRRHQLGEVDRHAQKLQTRDHLVQESCDLLRAVDEHVEVAAGGVIDILAGLEHHLVQAHRGQTFPQWRGTGRQITSESLERCSSGRRGRMHTTHPRDMFTRQRDDEVGTVELVLGCLPAAVIGYRKSE